jgi:hypothetical protein
VLHDFFCLCWHERLFNVIFAFFLCVFGDVLFVVQAAFRGYVLCCCCGTACVFPCFYPRGPPSVFESSASVRLEAPPPGGGAPGEALLICSQ